MKAPAVKRGQWIVLLLLLLVVVLPTACVLWFMAVAVENERDAVEQRLTSAYRSQLDGLARELGLRWAQRQDALDSVADDASGIATFARLVRAGIVDGLVLYGPQGEVLYPRDPAPSRSNAPETTEWLAAQALEFSGGDPAGAAEAFGRIAESVDDLHLAARALQARARCLAKAGRGEQAIAVLTETLTAERFASAQDPQGRSVVADAQLLALRLVDDPLLPAFERVADRLAGLLLDYESTAMPSTQRRFLMRQLQSLVPERSFDTLAAEDLSATYRDGDSQPPRSDRLSPSELPGVWALASQEGRVVALLREETIRDELLASAASSEDVTIDLLPPGAPAPSEEVLLSMGTGQPLSGWRLTLALADPRTFESLARGRIVAYLWGGALVVAAIVVLGVLIARLVGRQMRLTRLKNDLIATVSHELKTPLAGMRLLVDTLLDGNAHDETRVREYLELISKENERLSRLIEDFLTFSRMERNKQAFEKTPLAPQDVVDTAADAVRPRFEAAGCRFEVDVADGLPRIEGDADALSTVLVNLLDNAFKYSSEDKHIVLRSYPLNGDVLFEVEDNGIGMSRRAAKRIFERFYQADQRLDRSAEGVGLGLSIVDFIVQAHDGAVSVESEPGRGSTFRVRLPARVAGSA